MKIQSKRWMNGISSVFAIQLLCLLIMGIVEFFNMTQGCLPGINVHLLTNGGIVLSILGLWAITLWNNPRNLLRRDVILGILMVLWFLIVEGNRRINHIPLQSVTIFLAVYLVALPFASFTQDQDRMTGIRLASEMYIATAVLMLSFGLILLINGVFPGNLRSLVYWDGPRLFVIHHPNITSRIFMIGLALCMGFFGQIRKLWAKLFMLLAAILLFIAIALTNCRAVLLPACGLLAGNAFFLIYRKNRKYIIPGIIAAIVVAAVLFVSSSSLYQWNLSRLVNQAGLQTTTEQTLITSIDDVLLPAESADGATQEWTPVGNGNSSQPSLQESLPTMNGRTEIWTAVFEKILGDPAILLRGTIDSRLVLINMHTHNAWLEALLVLGLPGFLFVLIFSWNATWSSLRLLWHRDIGMFQKNIAMLALCSMVAALMEPSLFVTYTEWNFFDFFFFLCLGYLGLWSKQIPRKK